MKRRWQLWLGLTLSGVALVAALARIDLSRVGQTLAQADYRYLIPAVVLLMAYLLSRSVRWRLLLGPQVRLGHCFWVTNIGYLVSNVLPFRLGDPARAVVIGRGGKVTASAALSTVVVERVLDMLSVTALLAAIAPWIPGAASTLTAGLVAGGAALVALAVLLTLAFRPDWGRQTLRWALNRTPRLDGDRWAQKLDGLFDGLSALRSGWRSLALVAGSIAIWACVVGYYWAILRAFLPQPPALAAPFLTCVLALGMAVPSSPGAVGVFHAVARYGLTLPFGVPENEAIAVAFAAHALQYLLMCLLGLVGLARESLSLGTLRAEIAAVEEDP